MKKIIIYICLLLVFTMCDSKKSSKTMENDISNFKFYEKVTLTGVYTESNIAKSGKKTHTGHYKIIVNDTLEVILLPPYKIEAIRPEEEIKKFNEKKVTVTGIIVANTSLSAPSIEEQTTSVNIPCFITIESIQLAKEQ